MLAERQHNALCGPVFDIRQVPEIGHSEIIVSRKRTKNLGDFVNSWKKIVLSKLDERTAGEQQEVDLAPSLQSPSLVALDLANANAVKRHRTGSESSDSNTIAKRQRRLSSSN